MPNENIKKLNRDLCEDERFRVRRKPEVKREFFNYIKEYMSERGISGRADGGFEKTTNLIFGDEKKAEVLLTAHYDTSKSGLTMPPVFVTNRAGIIGDIAVMSCIIAFVIAGTTLSGVFLGWPYAALFFATCGVYTAFSFIFDNKFNFNDNTSGCIALLDVADRLSKSNPELFEKICFVFFDDEENGTLGSKKLKKRLIAESGRAEYSKKILLNFDCVGGRDKDICIYTHNQDGLSVANEIKAVAPKDAVISVYKTPLLPTDSMPFSDIRAVTFISTSKSAIKALTKLSDTHSKNDNFLDEAMIDFYATIATEYLNKI
ncbi:MAG: M28 family peptidase [Clostridiales bacterium]|nr:M28 family peptidase [Clostridiales bacterium]